MAKRFMALACICGFILSGCGFTKGSGKVIEQTRSVSNFTSVSVSGSGTLIIEQTGSESLSISAEDNIIDNLTSEVQGGQLVLGTKTGVSLNPTKDIVYRLTVKDLSAFSSSGSTDSTIRNLKTADFTLDSSGSATITITGSTLHQEISLSGSGDYNAEGFISQDTSITLSGNGQASVNSIDKLDVNISGSGDVEYTGAPAITQDISGSGSLRQR